MSKILFYGASVTAQAGQTGYFEQIRAKLSILGHEVTKVAYGGCHIDDAGFYRFESVLGEVLDYVVFEWNTTGLGLYNEFKIAYLLSRVKATGAKPLFLILPQEATIETNRNSENQIYALCRRFNLPLLDVRHGLSSTDFKLMVRDVVHTNELGANYYAERIFSFISSVLADSSAYWVDFLKYENKEAKFLTPMVMAADHHIVKGQKLKIVVSSYSNVYSEILVRHRIGPFSPVIEIDDGATVRRISLWDSYCHYEREHFSLLISNSDFKSSYLRDPLVFNLSICDENPRYELCRRSDIDFSMEKLICINEVYSIGVNYHIEIV